MQNLILLIRRKLDFSYHGKVRYYERRKKHLSFEKINREIIRDRIAESWNTSVLDLNTGNIVITRRGRRIINKGKIITYLKPKEQTSISTQKNHKMIHTYKPLNLEYLEKYRK